MAVEPGLQQLIGTALVDDKTARTLLLNPLALADRFGLTIPERRFIASARPRDLSHFAALVEEWYARQPSATGQPLARGERALLVS